MKISKKLESCDSCNVVTSAKDAAICKIKEAIEQLATCCPDDEIARDSIANLSVVLFDLQK